MRTECLRFKLGIKIYQWFGCTIDFVRDTEDRYIFDNLNKYYADYSTNASSGNVWGSFQDYVGLQKGMFEVQHGLYRKSLMLENNLLAKVYRMWYFKVKLPVSRKLLEWGI